ncbi:MAG: SDR family oxidoreductase [Proteobacteria bacterium]|nr:SDR family oxidoreductase [Pseudomonadota bacterium]
MTGPNTVFIAAISSDIGGQLAEHYVDAGYRVIGTFRQQQHVRHLENRDEIQLIQCDISEDSDLLNVASYFSENGLVWDHFISAVGLLSPIGKFVDLKARDWKKSVIVNSLQQLELLHHLYPYRRSGDTGKVAFLVGGAINRAFANYSAYSLGKVMLVKFCELISDETPDLHCVAIGTGWVASKIHDQTLAAGEAAGDNLETTQSFVDTQETGTPINDIYALINWCFARPETAGRNFSVVHDDWHDGGELLSSSLLQDEDMFRLRRSGNQHKSE